MFKYGPTHTRRFLEKMERNDGRKEAHLEISARFANFHNIARRERIEADQTIIDCVFENEAERRFGPIGEPRQGIITG